MLVLEIQYNPVKHTGPMMCGSLRNSLWAVIVCGIASSAQRTKVHMHFVYAVSSVRPVRMARNQHSFLCIY